MENQAKYIIFKQNAVLKYYVWLVTIVTTKIKL